MSTTMEKGPEADTAKYAAQLTVDVKPAAGGRIAVVLTAQVFDDEGLYMETGAKYPRAVNQVPEYPDFDYTKFLQDLVAKTARSMGEVGKHGTSIPGGMRFDGLTYADVLVFEDCLHRISGKLRDLGPMAAKLLNRKTHKDHERKVDKHWK